MIDTTKRQVERTGDLGSTELPGYIRLLMANGPLGFYAGDTNLYRYVGDDPTNEVDPSGLQEKKVEGKGIITSVKIIQKKGEIKEPPTWDVKWEGGVQQNDLGPYNDPKKRGEFQFVNWVMWQGENMGDVEIRRYYVSSLLRGNKAANLPDKSRGFKAGQLISDKGCEVDTPGSHNLRPEKPTTVLFVADGNGSSKLELNDFPFSYRTNFYEVAVSKKDKMILGEIWYDVEISATGLGPDNVITNKLKVTKIKIPGQKDKPIEKK